jgi:hypothetical protein
MKFNDGETKKIQWVTAKDIEGLKMRDGYKNTLRKVFGSISK